MLKKVVRTKKIEEGREREREETQFILDANNTTDCIKKSQINFLNLTVFDMFIFSFVLCILELSRNK